MFRTLLDQPQEALYKRHSVYCVRVMSVEVENFILVQPTDIKRTQLSATCVTPPEDEQVMLKTRGGP
jgi:hypothetical protein